jgi:hypothetical protein
VLAMSWSRLWSLLREECHLTEDQALAIVGQTKDLQYEASRDEIALALLSMA